LQGFWHPQHPPGTQLDHEQDVQALQGNGIDAEEVAREHPEA
jgi:hypothetical protein